MKETGLRRPVTRLPGFDEIELSCWQDFLDCSMRLLATLNGSLIDTHRLTLFDVLLLNFLADSDRGAARRSELAAGLMLAPSRVAQQLRRLEAQGLVSRGPTRYDRRGVLTSITHEGRARVEAALKTYAQTIRTHYLAQLSTQQMVALSDSCRRIDVPLKDAQHPARFRRL